ncbi:Uncharacterized protein APZ42_019275 [Daphnia magna]|uniref:Uncharacterized protein n=1 Tax=Daphnia magna TaxID=35525 RepID=A0A164YGA3_9CRUS|nr:Uncharacterized protein APZ42_019275 [Daphnia magna]
MGKAGRSSKRLDHNVAQSVMFHSNHSNKLEQSQQPREPLPAVEYPPFASIGNKRSFLRQHRISNAN